MKINKYLAICTLATVTILSVEVESADARRATRYGGSSTGSFSDLQEFITIIDGQQTGVEAFVPNENSSEVSLTIFEEGITDLFPDDESIGFFPKAIQSYVGTRTNSRGEPVESTCVLAPEFGGDGTEQPCLLTDADGSIIFDIVTTTESLFAFENLDLLATVLDPQVFYAPECELFNGFQDPSCEIGFFSGVQYEFKSGDDVVATFEIPYPNDFNPDFGFPEFQSFAAINDLAVIAQNFFNEQGISIPGATADGDNLSFSTFSEQLDIPNSNPESVPEPNSILTIIAVGLMGYRLRNKPRKR